MLGHEKIKINDVQVYKSEIKTVLNLFINFANIFLKREAIVLIDEYDTPYDRVCSS